MTWMHRNPPGAAAAALAGAALLVQAPAAAAPNEAAHQRTAIPAYWGPDTAGGAEMFARLAQNVPTSDIVVVNGSASKPEAPFHEAWADAIAKIHDAGALAIVYVDTGYYGFGFPPVAPHATRPDGPGGGGSSVADWTAQIQQDIDDWFALYGAYGVDGIFLDQVTALCGTAADPDLYVDLYAAVSDYISDNYPGAYVILNPGMPVEPCYEDIADTIVTFEGSYANYMDDNVFPTAPWQLESANPEKFWHLVYDVPDAAAMAAVVARSKQQNAGFVYVTDDQLVLDANGAALGHPWDTLPAYWDAELVEAAGVDDTLVPDPPDGLGAAAVSGTSTARATLTWNNPWDNVATAGYEVFKDGVSIGTTYGNRMTVTGLSPSTSYGFQVKAWDAAGNVSDLSDPLTVTTPAAAAASILSPSSCLSASVARYEAAYVDPFTHHRVFIDSDNDTTTGYHLPPGQPAGVDHMIENGALYRYVGPGWAWVQVSGVSPLVSTTDDVYVWEVPLSALVGAATTQVLVFQGGSPDAYSATLTVSQSTGC
ncbi:spherulation-specific family 4 protein [Sorangium sp. So ce296]|uniref:spherulation-specific family 4 protein n=1 Tax=Sorangium sp. So ce296 TaxID=3133296 RepID=UPI003F5DD110